MFPNGHLHTFEFHQQRSETARKEFEVFNEKNDFYFYLTNVNLKEHQMSDYVTVYHRDICAEGFKMQNVADAVFLDIPNPWKAIKSAKDAIKQEGGRICSFSPCIEQVQKTVEELKTQNFIDIQTFENLRCVYSVKSQIFPEFDFQMNSMNKNVEAERSSNKKSRNNKSQQKNDSEDSDTNMDEGNYENVYKPYCSKPINLQPGHTGYLTFGTLVNKIFSKGIPLIETKEESVEKLNS